MGDPPSLLRFQVGVAQVGEAASPLGPLAPLHLLSDDPVEDRVDVDALLEALQDLRAAPQGLLQLFF
jgi:hypothetical protein